MMPDPVFMVDWGAVPTVPVEDHGTYKCEGCKKEVPKTGLPDGSFIAECYSCGKWYHLFTATLNVTHRRRNAIIHCKGTVDEPS